MDIRLLDESDADKFWSLRLRALREEPQAFSSSYEAAEARPQAERQAHFANLVKGQDNFVAGAFDGDALVGIMGLYRESGAKVQHRGNVWGVYVAPEARGQGVAKALLGKLIEQARAIPGLEQLHLGVVTTQTAARRFYLAQGFETYGTEPNALKIDGRYLNEDLMILRLTQL